MNQVLFQRLYIYDEAVDAELTELFECLLSPDLKELLDEELTSARRPARATAPK